jgi:hypothetical protein
VLEGEGTATCSGCRPGTHPHERHVGQRHLQLVEGGLPAGAGQHLMGAVVAVGVAVRGHAHPQLRNAGRARAV